MKTFFTCFEIHVDSFYYNVYDNNYSNGIYKHSQLYLNLPKFDYDLADVTNDYNCIFFLKVIDVVQLLNDILITILKKSNIDESTVVWTRGRSDKSYYKVLHCSDMTGDLKSFQRKKKIEFLSYCLCITSDSGKHCQQINEKIMQDYHDNYENEINKLLQPYCNIIDEFGNMNINDHRLLLICDAFERSCKNLRTRLHTANKI